MIKKRYFVVVLFCAILLCANLYGQQNSVSNAPQQPTAQMQGWFTHYTFEENKGQVRGADASKVRYTIQQPGIAVFIQ